MVAVTGMGQLYMCTILLLKINGKCLRESGSDLATLEIQF